MQYNVHLSDLRGFYNNTYLNQANDLSFFNSKDSIESDVLKVQINEWKTTQFKTHMLQIESKKELNISGGINEHTVVLHFVCKGDALVKFGENKMALMKENTNNFFLSSSEQVIHTFRENTQYEFFKVFLPYDYILNIGEQNVETFESLLRSISLEQPILFNEPNSITTIEMNTVIDQIKNCHLMGNMAAIYYEAKIQELLCLQIKRKIEQTNIHQGKHKHHQNQVIEARNILEKQFQNPPTINKLAIDVGVSATVLKESFKSIIGNTVYGYLLDYRMSIARKYLLDTNLTIAEIAEKSGYEHACHFTTAFKRKFGMVPSVYRKNQL